MGNILFFTKKPEFLFLALVTLLKSPNSSGISKTVLN